MIKKITIEGFESHKKTELPLCTGINIIIGKSDIGKSAIVRSEKLVNQNTPKGEAYKNDTLGKKDIVKITNTFHDGNKISIERKNGKNQYKINKDKEPLKALNGTVPEEIQSITRMKPINIQGQHPTEQYFLLAESPGAVAKKFNEVVGISVMDKALSKTNSMTREANSELKIIEVEIQSTKEKIKNLKWVKKAIEQGEKLKKKRNAFEALMVKGYEIEQNIKKINKIDTKLKKFKGLKKALTEVNRLILVKKEINTQKNQNISIKTAIFELNKLDKALCGSIDIDKALKQLKKLIKTKEDLSTKRQYLNLLTNGILQVHNKNMEVLKSTKQLRQAQKQFDKLLTTEICPICGRRG